MSTYETLSGFAVTWGLALSVVIFAVVLVYALWPRNRKSFNEASRIPLEED